MVTSPAQMQPFCLRISTQIKNTRIAATSIRSEYQVFFLSMRKRYHHVPRERNVCTAIFSIMLRKRHQLSDNSLPDMLRCLLTAVMFSGSLQAFSSQGTRHIPETGILAALVMTLWPDAIGVSGFLG